MSESVSLPGPDDRSYEATIAILRSRTRPQRPGSSTTRNPSESRILDGKEALDVRGKPSIAGMKEWLLKLGHTASDVDRLRIIHVAGTKGKGNTCAFAESFLRLFGQRTGFPRKTGLYTSPHLVYIEERIRIDSQPLDRQLFARYFFEIWDSLSGCKSLPRYLQSMALLSLHTFIREGVEAAIIETHHGGEYDATNFIEQPVVTAITPLGMDHVKQLGPTIRSIAWHKAGIFKPGARAFSALQDHPEAIRVLYERAEEKQIPLSVVSQDDPELVPYTSPNLTTDVQRGNCSVALAAVRAWVEETCPEQSLQPVDIEQAISQFSWPGKFQHVSYGDKEWFLDGAHNEMSVDKAAEWFVEMSQALSASPTSPPRRILIFYQKSDERDPGSVMERLAESLMGFQIDHVIFADYDPNQSFVNLAVLKRHEGSDDRVHLQQFIGIWERYHPHSITHMSPDIEGAIKMVLDLAKAHGNAHTLITGSLHLVGGALHCFQRLTNSENIEKGTT